MAPVVATVPVARREHNEAARKFTTAPVARSTTPPRACKAGKLYKLSRASSLRGARGSAVRSSCETASSGTRRTRRRTTQRYNKPP